MSDQSDYRSRFSKNLDQLVSTSQERLQADMDLLRQVFRRSGKPLPSDLEKYLMTIDEDLSIRLNEPPARQIPVQPLVDLNPLSILDHLVVMFFNTFNLTDYYDRARLSFPTNYCDTLEEFYAPMADYLVESDVVREVSLEKWVKEAEEEAERTKGGGVFGYYLPGKACYLNGWLFVYGQNISPKQAFNQDELRQSILRTVVHEKFGHGFLNTYSELGKIKSELGLDLLELARRFGAQTADDPVSTLRLAQHNLIYSVSQLIEEGWSTWLATYLGSSGELGGAPGVRHPRHNLADILNAIQKLAFVNHEDLSERLEDRLNIQQSLLTALAVIFSTETPNLMELHKAIINLNEKGSRLEKYFGAALGQPLCYAVGEMIFTQAEANQGAFCMPYLTQIAANVTYDFSQIGLTDLKLLLNKDPRLHPDTRLACLSRLKLQEKGSLEELIYHAKEELSFSIPPELKSGWNR